MLSRIVSELLLLTLIDVGYRIVGMVQDRTQYPSPGKLIDVGGHKLHLYYTGEESPTVALYAWAD